MSSTLPESTSAEILGSMGTQAHASIPLLLAIASTSDLPKDLVTRAAIRALVVRHVLDQAQHWHVHVLGHADGLLDDHVDEHLRGGRDDDALEGELLEHRHGDVTRSRGMSTIR